MTMSLSRNLFFSLMTCFIVVSVNIVVIPEASGQSLQRLEQQKTLTPLTEVGLLTVLRDSFYAKHGKLPSANMLASAWAQVALENAHGNVIWNHNIGNIGPGPTHEWYKHSSLTRYRSYPSFIDGGIAYWHTVSRCKSAFAMFNVGSIQDAGENLKRCGYFEADLEQYVRAMKSLYEYALHKVIPNEEQKRRNDLIRYMWEEYQQTHAFTPRCACSTNNYGD